MTRKGYTEEQIGFALRQAVRHGGDGDVPQAGRQPTDVLPVP